MDAVMPRMGRVEAARAMPPVLIVFMTGYPDQLEILHEQMVVEKLFTLERLVRMMEKVKAVAHR